MISRWAADTRTDEELFHVVVTETDDDKHSHAVFTLRYRGTREIYDTAVRLCHGRLAVERRQGVNVLAQFRNAYGRKHPYRQETIDLFVDMLASEKRVTVISMLLWGLEQLDDDRVVELMVRFKEHPNKWVRKQAAIALGHFAHCNEQALRAVVDLCRDPDRDVRDWATFELGSQFDPEDLDIPEAHTVLWERANEDDREIRSQALRGLVFRGEVGLTECLMRELDADEIFDDVLEAVEYLADPAFLPRLLKLRTWKSNGLYDLEDAIAACGGTGERE